MGFFKQPQGYYRLFSAMILERFCFLGLAAFLPNFFMTFLNSPESKAMLVQRIFVLLCSVLPFFGGLLSDTLLKKRNTLLLSVGLLFLGLLFLAVGLFSSLPFFFYSSLVFVASGESLFLPQLSKKLVTLYTELKDSRIEGNFVFFTVAMNLGAFFAPFNSLLAERYSWKWVILILSLLMAFTFWLLRKVPNNVEEKNEKATFAFIGQALLLFFTVLFPFAIVIHCKEILFRLYSEGNQEWQIMTLFAFVLTFGIAFLFPWLWVKKALKGKPQSFFKIILFAILSLLLGGALLALMVGYFPDVSVIPLMVPAVIVTLFAFSQVLISPLITALIGKNAPRAWMATTFGALTCLIASLNLASPLIEHYSSSEIITLAPFFLAFISLAMFLLFRKAFVILNQK